MRKSLLIIGAVLACGIPAFAQMGGSPGGANFDNGMEKLFGANPVFTATMKTDMSGPQGPMTVKSKMYFDHENSRTEMNMSDVEGPNLPPGAMAQMQSLGMDKVVTLTPSDKKTVYVIYPNISSYAAMPVPAPTTTSTAPAQVQLTKIGDETVDGHPCVKSKAIVIKDGQTNEFTVWNANDEKNFPIKIAMADQGMSATISFQDISFDAISADQFQPPASYKRYSTVQDLMQSVMMSHYGVAPAGGASAPTLSPAPGQ